MTLSKEDMLGIKNMREYINEFLNNHRENNELVWLHLKEVAANDDVLLYFLWGRKYRAHYAWETLRRNAEVRLIECPQLFPDTIPTHVVTHSNDRNLLGVLKTRDSHGRYVVVFNAGAWDPELCSLDEMLALFIHLMERLLKIENFAKHGFTYIHLCLGVGFKHAKQYSLNAIRKLISVFWHSFPIQLKTIYYVNVPRFLHYLFMIGKTFCPKKLKERLVITSLDDGFQEIHRIISPSELPTFLGGNLSFHEAMEESFSIF